MKATAADDVEVSVVIPTYARAASIDRLLASLARQDEAPRFEVVVSIDGSQDGTREIVGGYAGRVPVRWLWQANRGRAAACNAGAREARGNLLVLLDDDMEPAPRFLREHLRAHAGEHPRAVVGPAPIRCDDASPPLVRYRASGFARKLERLHETGADLRVLDMYTGNFSVARQAFLEAGGFDEGFSGYGNEDFELLFRIRRAGIRLGFAPSALAIQHYEKQYADLARDTTNEGGNAVLLAERHPTIVDDLYLVQLHRARGPRRAALALGSRLAGVWPGLLSALAAYIRREERRDSPRLPGHYDLAFDLHYCLGVRKALRDRGRGKPLTWGAWLRALRARAAAEIPP